MVSDGNPQHEFIERPQRCTSQASSHRQSRSAIYITDPRSPYLTASEQSPHYNFEDPHAPSSLSPHQDSQVANLPHETVLPSSSAPSDSQPVQASARKSSKGIGKAFTSDYRVEQPEPGYRKRNLSKRSLIPGVGGTLKVAEDAHAIISGQPAGSDPVPLFSSNGHEDEDTRILDVAHEASPSEPQEATELKKKNRFRRMFHGISNMFKKKLER